MGFTRLVSRVQHARLAVIGSTLLILSGALAASASGQDTTLAARSMGSKTAPVTVYEMADFQCPWCGKFARETFPSIKKEYIATGKVRWIFINFPIPSIHPNAMAAAEFAACAARQDRFWQAHDMLYATQDKWDQLKDPAPYFLSQVPTLKLDRGQLQTCLQSGAGTKMVNEDLAGVARSGAHSTPAFYIEGGLMSGYAPIETFRPILDSVYKAKTAKGK
jgi:protein-disulfide isomerase